MHKKVVILIQIKVFYQLYSFVINEDTVHWEGNKSTKMEEEKHLALELNILIHQLETDPTHETPPFTKGCI